MELIVMMLLTLAVVAGGNDDWTKSCPMNCRCLWSGGKKTAECNKLELTAVPDTLSDVTQVLMLNDNRIHSLNKDAFRLVKLLNLHKLFIKSSNITFVDKAALSGMTVLIELDLSHNNILTLHHDLFRECEKIREIFLSYNRIQKIDAGLFTNLKYLQKVELNNCQIKEIEAGSFVNVPKFSTLNLRGNQLSFLDLNVVRDIGQLHSLSLMDNPWDCNCHLRTLRAWVLEKNLYTDPIICREGKSWKDMTDLDFACAPQVLSIAQDGWVLSCRVHGDPQPLVDWFFNGKPVNNHSYTGAEYLVRKSDEWYNLTVRHARSRDNGEYKCRATNEGGVQDARLAVTFLEGDDEEGFGGVPGAVTDVWPLIVGVVVGAVLLLAVVLVVCCCFCKKHRRIAGKKDANGTVGALEAEEKTLMQSVNPVQKPPRRQETALNTSETELLDAVSLPYTENGSFMVSTLHDSQLDSSVGHAPDLITIPGKTIAVSPTAKPLGSSQFGTLPYARSHSPFSPPAPVVPRSGYVTIPRRPRVPSWTASLSPVVSPDDGVAVLEPVYDRLGPRTTADGSSVLSLNKMDIGLPTAYKNRPLPLAPVQNPGLNDRRQSWSRATPDVSDERQLLIATSPQPSIAPAKKIPPNPPPKPKKKVHKLFDDEGENGTEV